MDDSWVHELAGQIKKRNASRVLLQLPEGLAFMSARIIDLLRQEGIDACSWMEPTYGACDIVPEVAEKLGMDLLVHVGHVKFYRYIPDKNVLYFPLDISLDANEFSEELKQLPAGDYAVATTVQHLKSLNEFVELLIKLGYKARNAGYLLGCMPPVLRRDESLLFIGSGEFHPSGLPAVRHSMALVFILDVERHELRKLDSASWLRKRMAMLAKASMAETFGILVSIKHGQWQLLGKADEIRKRLEARGKRAYVLVMNHISDEKLDAMNIDCFINTACPRIADSFGKLMVNASDIDELEGIWDKSMG